MSVLGMHWIADAVGCSRERLTAPAIRDALIELPARLGLTRVGEPQVAEATGGAPGGVIAGVVLLSESHVSVHVFVEERAAHVDVFSCRAFEADLARAFVEEFFGAEGVVVSVRGRGTDARDANARATPRTR